MWTDSWTDMMKLIVAFCSFANAPKNVPLKDCEPLTLRHALGQKNKRPTSSSKLCHPTAIWVQNVTAETHAYGIFLNKKIKKKLGVNFQYGMNVVMVCKKRCCHFWGSLSTLYKKNVTRVCIQSSIL